MARKVPRQFKYEWGGGQIVEEIAEIREALNQTPRLRSLLQQLVAD